MAEGINVRLTGKLQDFVKTQSDPEVGTFSSASEYIRHLIREHYEQSQEHGWETLKSHLEPGLNAKEEEFVETSAEDIISEARKRKALADAS
ncbi:MAG: hypothetical protein P1V20_09180 [Verrucomicrobiales bacterium]|nr:hypothetical protein [Verrucomicrobiales bacterium]